MKKYICILFVICLLTGCNEESFENIPENISFMASMNILEPSIQFFSQNGEELADWSLEKAYTGAVLVSENTIVFYGNQLSEIDFYQLSTGKKIKSIKTEKGSTNGYYDEKSALLFITNSKTNKVYCYDTKGEKKGEITVRNYPMSMAANNGKLYVINYKDTLLSVIHIDTLKVEVEWSIPSSSNGIWIDESNHQLWLGGHGEGAKANVVVSIYNLSTGMPEEQLTLPTMPIAIASNETQQAVISHGNSMVYIIEKKKISNQIKVAANPFAASYFNNQLVVAGYDDATLYFIEDGEIVKKIATDKGPFQLLTREESK